MRRAALAARPAGSERSISALTVVGFAVPPALLLQRQTWVVPRTGLGAGPGLVVAVVLVLLTCLLMASDQVERVAGRGPVPRLLLLWLALLSASYLAWSVGGLPQLGVQPTIALGQNLAEAVFVLGLTASLLPARRGRQFVEILVLCGGAYGALLVSTAVLGTDVAPSLRLPFLLPGADLSGVESMRAGFVRPQGMAGHPLEAGTVAAILAPLGIGLARASRGRRTAFWWLMSGLLVAGSLSTLSRSATVGLAVALAVMALRSRPRAIVAGAGAVVAAMTVGALVAPARFAAYADLFGMSARTDSSLMSRSVAREQALETISTHFWTGRGVGSHLYLGGRILDNQFLGFAVEQGVPVMVAFIALLLVPIWFVLQRYPCLPERDRPIALALGGSLAVVAVCSLVLDIFGFPQVRLLVFVLLALTGVFAGRSDKTPAPATEGKA